MTRLPDMARRETSLQPNRPRRMGGAAAVSLMLACASISRGEEYGPNNLPPFVHPPVMKPIPDGIKLDVPQELGNQELARLGFVDVTAEPFRADPTGQRDSTQALQRAINFARDAQMVCFFPPGTYTVSDTLLLRHGIHMRSHRATFMNNLNMPCVLVGSREGEGRAGYARPKIVLRPRAPGFDDPDKPKYVIEHQQYGVRKFTVKKNRAGGGASLMNTMVVNLDIAIGRGNPGAVGMLIRSCEGSAVQDMTIDATHGFAGLAGATGNGGSWTNITVIGGKVGLDMRGWTPPTPTMEGITLIHQTQAAIMTTCRGPLTAVGVKIVSRIRGPVIQAKAKKWGIFDCGLNLIDSQIVFKRTAASKGKTVAIVSNRSVYMNNVYVRGADAVVDGGLAGNPKGWLRVQEFAQGRTPRQVKGYSLSAPIYVDGKKVPGPLRNVEPNAAPPKGLEARHVWAPGFPSWQSPGAADVKAPPYNAKGDSYADDTDALQRAIDANEIVFLPKGYYRITRTLQLKPRTKLVGVAQHLSIIMARDPARGFAKDGQPGPLVATADDGDAETVLAFVGIRFPREVAESYRGAALPVYSLKWQCGPQSVFRTVDVNPLRVYGFIGARKHKQPPLGSPAVLVTGHGAGRWYNYHAGHFFMGTTKDSRAILIDRAAGPLQFYNFEPQGGDSAAVAEIRRSRYVSIYGCKTECDTTFLRVVDSDHIRVFGHGGIGNASAGGALYVFERTPNFLISNLADQVNLRASRPYYGRHSMHRNIKEFFPLLHQQASGRQVRVPSLERPVLYRFGHPLARPPAMQ